MRRHGVKSLGSQGWNADAPTAPRAGEDASPNRSAAGTNLDQPASLHHFPIGKPGGMLHNARRQVLKQDCEAGK
ncbi:MAG TPA: hypothetical protein VM492_12770 [Sumerlaeia bacterium]|nr:hypothetical protein [Sumerlaeia bacterium]